MRSMLTVRSEIGPYRRHSDFVVFLRKFSTPGALLSLSIVLVLVLEWRGKVLGKQLRTDFNLPLPFRAARLLGCLSPGLNLNSEIETADSADFAEFEEVIGVSLRIFSWQNFRALINVTYCIRVICG